MTNYQFRLRVRIFDLLEKKTTTEEKKEGLDIADFLVRFPLAKFKNGYTTLPP